MRSLRSCSLVAIASMAALFVACEPDLDALSANYGQGGTAGRGGNAGMSGGGGSSSAHGGSTEPGESGGSGATSGMEGSGGSVVMTDTCSDKKKNSGETDVDCGGDTACDRCPEDKHCMDDEDCDNAVCLAKVCTKPTCDDGITDQEETGIDCGGPCVEEGKTCDVYDPCRSNDDCESGFCSGGTCKTHCENNDKDVDETDVDCGGADCAACDLDQTCSVNDDCDSKVCKDDVCIMPDCMDGVLDQDETDVDCGGVCGANCEVDAACKGSGDCSTYVCNDEVCAEDITIPPEDIIDDIDSSAGTTLPTTGGRLGNWYAFANAGTRTITRQLLDPPRGDSEYAYRALIENPDGVNWGGIGFDLNNPGNIQSTKQGYDLSAYTAITFWAKASATINVSAQMSDMDTTDLGTNPSSGMNESRCMPCNGQFTKGITITPDWQRFTIKFSELTLGSGTTLKSTGMPPAPAINLEEVTTFQIFVGGGNLYDFLIDDVGLIK